MTERDTRLHNATAFWRLADGDLQRLLEAVRDADCLELKLLVAPAEHAAVCAALGAELKSASVRHVYFLDTPDLLLERHGLVVRVRSILGKPDDSVVKLRPLGATDLPSAVRRAKRFVIEIDGIPGAHVRSASLKARLATHAVERAITGRRPLSALFSERQRALLASRAPAGVDVDDLLVLGPVEVRRRKLAVAGLDAALLIERWTYPDGSRMLELSTRSHAHEALRILEQTAAVLSERGIAPAASQLTKTRAVLDFFTADDSGAPERPLRSAPSR
jgi:hypothetical protein